MAFINAFNYFLLSSFVVVFIPFIHSVCMASKITKSTLMTNIHSIAAFYLSVFCVCDIVAGC